MKKKKIRIKIKNGMKDKYGTILGDSGKSDIRINVRAHKGDKRELASTIKHEMLHVRHPSMTEKEVYKKSAKTKISEGEQNKLIAKLRTKSRNYKVGALKRKYKLGREVRQPGELFNSSVSQKTVVKKLPTGSLRTVIMGAV